MRGESTVAAVRHESLTGNPEGKPMQGGLAALNRRYRVEGEISAIACKKESTCSATRLLSGQLMSLSVLQV